MTDTQEAMREKFRVGVIEELFTKVGMADALIHARNLELACAQSAEKIEYYKSANAELLEEGRTQREKIARLEEFVDRLRTHLAEMEQRHLQDSQKLAAAELSNKQLREVGKRASVSLGAFCSDEGWGQADMDNMDNLDAVLAQQPSTEALDAYVKDEIKRRHDAAKQFNDCLPQFKGDVMHPPVPEKRNGK